MDFTLDSEQAALRDAVRGLLKAYDPAQAAEHRRQVVREDPGYDEQMWRRLAEMGVLGLPFADDLGGMGAGPVEVSVVAEEMGRVLAPEPFVESVVLAGGLVDRFGTEEQRKEILGALSAGDLVLAFAWADPADGGDLVRVDDDRLTGVKEPVLHGGRADVLVVLAEDRLFLVQGEDTEPTSYSTFDGGRAARIRFDRAPATLLGDGGGVTDAVKDVLAAGMVAYSHEALGAMDTALRLTTEYLKTRKQFGVPLNKFQALTFRAADMYVSLELARSTALWASMVLDAGGDVVLAADRARLQTSRAGRHVGKEAIQLHGGIGMTAEYKVGHYTSRLTAIDHVLGDGDWAVERLASSVYDHPTVDPLGAPYTS